MLSLVEYGQVDPVWSPIIIMGCLVYRPGWGIWVFGAPGGICETWVGNMGVWSPGWDM